MLGNAANPMLQQAEQGIEAKVPDNLKGALTKVIHAGMTILYSPNLSTQLQQRISATKDPVAEAAQGSARMVSNLFKQSGKKIPVPIIVPAAMIFAFEYLDLLAKAGKAQITPDMIAQTTQAVADAVLPLMGITKDKLAQLVQQSQQGQGAGPRSAPVAAAPPQSAGIIGRAQGAA